MKSVKYTLDEHDAFLAMTHFLIKFADRTSGKNSKNISPQVALLLADIEIQGDGQPNDPAAWYDWLKSIESAKKKIPLDQVKD